MNAKEKITFEKTIILDGGFKKIAFMDSVDNSLYSYQDLMREIPFLLEDGYTVEVLDRTIINDQTGFDYLKEKILLDNILQI